MLCVQDGCLALATAVTAVVHLDFATFWPLLKMGVTSTYGTVAALTLKEQNV